MFSFPCYFWKKREENLSPPPLFKIISRLPKTLQMLYLSVPICLVRQGRPIQTSGTLDFGRRLFSRPVVGLLDICLSRPALLPPVDRVFLNFPNFLVFFATLFFHLPLSLSFLFFFSPSSIPAAPFVC